LLTLNIDGGGLSVQNVTLKNNAWWMLVVENDGDKFEDQ
jgi:hypothetical protein